MNGENNTYLQGMGHAADRIHKHIQVNQDVVPHTASADPTEPHGAIHRHNLGTASES